MNELSIIGLDLAKNVFQAHGSAADGSIVFRRKLTRLQVLKFFAEQPRCTVAMEACASAHHWARAIAELGHAVKLTPPAYVKPFVKRQKNDMADAEAIAEAAARPTMRFVAPKSEAQQAAAMAYRTRELLVRQRTQTINALRGHLAEYGVCQRRRQIRPRGGAKSGQWLGAERHGARAHHVAGACHGALARRANRTT
uniref:IS110 family transposase n=1 Tax=Blastomonas sp. TaxID=1909299 RepID=UPI00359361D0